MELCLLLREPTALDNNALTRQGDGVTKPVKDPEAGTKYGQDHNAKRYP